MSARDIILNTLPARTESPELFADAILRKLTAAGYRLLGPGDGQIDDIATSMWKTEAEDCGAPKSVAAGRTRSAFDEQSEELKARWRKFAHAALRTLTGGEDE